ncbi:MAG: ribosome silencing factor [Planctomycetota bacterium]|nr:ribosome silencing factor [Planctomycetota bacterium]
MTEEKEPEELDEQKLEEQEPEDQDADAEEVNSEEAEADEADADEDDTDEADADEDEADEAESDDQGPLHGEDLARKIADLCFEKKGADIKILDMTRALGVTDFFVLCSATNERQCKVIAQYADHAVKTSGGYRSAPMEGLSGSTWICGDFGDVILHVFSEDQR